jgi:hypothetical protein
LPTVSFEQALAAASSELDRAVDRAALDASVAEAQRIAALHPADAEATDAIRTVGGRAVPNLLALASGAHAPAATPRKLMGAAAPLSVGVNSSARRSDWHTQAALELVDVRQQLSEREDALRKVQSVLQSIQAAFHSLTEKEMQLLKATASLSPASCGPSGDAESQQHQAMVDALAQQKRTVFEREKKLLAQRNAVWREIETLHDRRSELERTVSQVA